MTVTREILMERALAETEALMSMRRRAMCDQPLYRGVSMPQIYILVTILERGSMTVSELASLLNVSTPSASSIVDRMEEHDLVTRTRDDVDRRVVHVDISAHGRTVVDGMMGMHRDITARLLATMSDEDLGHVVRGIEAVRHAVKRFDDAGAEPMRTTVVIA